MKSLIEKEAGEYIEADLAFESSDFFDSLWPMLNVSVSGSVFC